MARSRTVATVSVDVDANTGRFKTGVTSAAKAMEKFGKKGSKSMRSMENATRKMALSLKSTTSGAINLKSVFLALAASLVVRKLISTTVQFEKMSASLETVTGSVSNADRAFETIKEFAATTPFQLSEAVDGFIKLKALGLDPSAEALRSYGNTASAMGKSLNQMVEAIADAATGEFERLKEFGIKASSEGDKVSFTFQGVTTTVGKNADEIEGFLRSIGEIEFAGAMERQMDTLGGAFSNLEDSSDLLLVAIGETGLSDAFKGATLALSGLLQETTKFVENPASMKKWADGAKASISALIAPFSVLKEIIGGGLQGISRAISGDFSEVTEVLKERAAAISVITNGLGAEIEAIGKLSDKVDAMKSKSKEDDGDGPNTREVFTPVLSEEEFELEFDRAEEQFRKLEEQFAKHAKAEEKIEMQKSRMIQSMRLGVAQQALGLFKMIAGESKGAALAILAAEKALAIAQTIMNTEVAVMKAMTLDPTGILAAKVRTMGSISVGIIATTGLLQAAGLGGGGSGVGGVPATDTASGSPVPPPTVFDDSNSQGSTGGSITFNIVGGMVTEEIVEDMIIPRITDALNNKDFVLFSSTSSQAEELQ